MSYAIEKVLASKNGWHTPAEAKAYYGRYSREGITVHWWDLPERAGTHDGTVGFIRGKAAKGTGSVNYVLSNTKISMLVEPDNVAWASQSGNPTTISIEFDPRLNAEGYKKAGWLINELEKRYKRTLTLYPHKHWFNTACPGTLDLNRMRAEANKWKSGAYNKKEVDVYKGNFDGKAQEKNAKGWYDQAVLYFGRNKTNKEKLAAVQTELVKVQGRLDIALQNPSKENYDALAKQLEACRLEADKPAPVPTPSEDPMTPTVPESSSNWLTKLLAYLFRKKA